MGVQRGTQAGCVTNVPAAGWLAAALVCEETITKLNEDIKEGGPFPASANRTRVCSASGARRGGPAHHPQNVAPLRMAGDPHFAHHCRVVAGAGPFVVFGDACPACSVPSGRTPEIVRNKRIPLLVPRPAQNRSRSW